MSTKERDEMADKDAKENVDPLFYGGSVRSFKAGYDACLASLMAKAPKFDEKKCFNDWSLSHSHDMPFNLFRNGAKYYHEQSALREAALREEAEGEKRISEAFLRDTRQREDIFVNELTALKEENAQLREKLFEADQNINVYAIPYREAQDQLTALREENSEQHKALVKQVEENERLKAEIKALDGKIVRYADNAALDKEKIEQLSNGFWGRTCSRLQTKLTEQEALLRECLPHINGYSPEGAELYAKLKAHLGER